MFKSLFSAVSLAILAAPEVFACQPPPVNYFNLGSLQAIVESQEVRQEMSSLPITSIAVVPNTGHSQWIVDSNGECHLRVTVKAVQQNPDFPCGGPFTFSVESIQGPVCQ